MKKISKNTILFILIAISMLVSGGAFAATSGGQITFYHLNSAVAGRDACVRMVPKISSPSGWACLYNNNPLRSQIANLMMHAYEQGTRCAISWSANSSEGFAIIQVVECGNTY